MPREADDVNDDFDDVDDNDDDLDDDRDGDDDDSDTDDGDNRRSRRNDTDDKNRQKDTPSARRALRRERSKVRQLEATVNQLSETMRKHGIGSEQRVSTSRRSRSNGGGNGNGNGREEAQTVDVDAIRREIQEELQSKFREDSNARSIASAAVLALGEAGFTGRARRGVRLLDLADVTVDDDGNVDEDELEDAIEALKDESPGLFRPSRRNRSARSSGRQRDRDDDEEFEARDSRGESRRDRSEGMGRRSGGGSQPKDSLERAIMSMVGSSRRRER